MSTVVRRTLRSSPHRDATETWEAIVELLTQSKDSDARHELQAVAGIASSLISDQTPKNAPIIITCDGPRTRIYCIYDEDAIEGSDASEDSLGFDPLNGDWALSFPCSNDELGWVQPALKKHSDRITARDLDTGIVNDEDSTKASQSMTLDVEGFLKS